VSAAMPSKQKLNLEKVRASLSTACPKCGHDITPAEVRRVDTTHLKCPACGEVFETKSR
jgi:predicted RNA-binding Zn-ribbon protein involved in translation (DUF1610 family)